VFQGTVVPGIGMLLLPWSFQDGYAAAAVVLAISGSAWLYFLQASGRLNGQMLLCNGFLYGLFLAYVMM